MSVAFTFVPTVQDFIDYTLKVIGPHSELFSLSRALIWSLLLNSGVPKNGLGNWTNVCNLLGFIGPVLKVPLGGRVPFWSLFLSSIVQV